MDQKQAVNGNGGKRPGSGRKALSADMPTVRISARVTEEQAAVFKILGPAWLRAQLDAAAEKDHQ